MLGRYKNILIIRGLNKIIGEKYKIFMSCKVKFLPCKGNLDGMGAFQSSMQQRNAETKYVWKVEESPKASLGLIISPVFTQDKEAFVAVLHAPSKTLILYCCSALQWSFDETFNIKIKLNFNLKKKVNTISTFTKSRPFCSIKYETFPYVIQFRIQMPPFYPYTREERYVGIRNSGATCYMAAVLQVLYNLGAFRQLVYSFNQPPQTTSAIQQLFVELQLSSKPPTVDKLLRALGNAAEIARIQQDTHEFLLAILEKLENELGIVFKNNLKLMMQVDLSVSTDNKIENTITNTEEALLTLPLTVDGLHGIKESLSLLVSPETINLEKGDIIQKRSITKLPPVMSFQLCRFKFSQTEGKVVEVKSKFICPETIDMKDFVDHPYNDETKYNLFAVVAHCGTPESGHYISYIKLAEKWTKFDDINVTTVEFSEVQQSFGSNDGENSGFSFLFTYGAPVAYLVFYVRDDCDKFIDAGDSVPVFLAPYRSDCLFSKFVFYDQIKDEDVMSFHPFTEWRSKKDTFSEVISRIRPDFDQNAQSIWIRFAGHSLFIGPISLNEVAAKYIIKGHSNIFFVLPNTLDYGPVFLLTESLPRKVIAVDLPSQIIKYLPPNSKILKYGHVMQNMNEVATGTNVLAHSTQPFRVIVNNDVYQMPLNATYGDLQQRVALKMNTSPAKIIFYTSDDILYPENYPYVTKFPSKVDALILDNGITSKSISLYTPIRLLLVYPTQSRRIEWPLWMKIGSTCADIESEIQRRYTDFKVNPNLKLLLSRGSESQIEKIYYIDDIPTKGITRVDSVRDYVPIKRNNFKDILYKSSSFSIEVRLSKGNAFYGTSRLLSISPQTTLREIVNKMLRMSRVSDEFTKARLFVAEKPKIFEEIEQDDIVITKLTTIVSKMTALKQRVCLSIDTQDPLQAGRFIIRSQSDYFDL